MADSPKPTFFLNLPVASIDSSTKFYTSIGFTHIKDWSDASTTAFLLPSPNQSVCLMIHTHTRFKEFMRPNTSVVDAKSSTETLFSFMCDNKEAVDGWLEKVEQAGGKRDPYVMEKYGEGMGMYTRSWEDLDGHIWEVLVMTGPCGGSASGEGAKA